MSTPEMSLFKLSSFKIYNRAALSAHCPLGINDTQDVFPSVLDKYFQVSKTIEYLK